MFGLNWSAPQAAVLRRFEGTRPGLVEDRAVVFPLASIAERLVAEEAFCPTALKSSPERMHDEVGFTFGPQGLATIHVRFGYPFEAIGLKPENLSEQAMVSFARAEFTVLLHEFATRYGAPGTVTEMPARTGHLHCVGMAVFMAEDVVIRLRFGHDGGALAGELTYLPPAPSGGF